MHVKQIFDVKQIFLLLFQVWKRSFTPIFSHIGYLQNVVRKFGTHCQGSSKFKMIDTLKLRLIHDEKFDLSASPFTHCDNTHTFPQNKQKYSVQQLSSQMNFLCLV